MREHWGPRPSVMNGRNAQACDRTTIRAIRRIADFAMNRWTDPRFHVYAPARVARIEEPETEMDAEVLDVSPAGLRLVTAEELQEGQIITIETDRHLILADVRSCVARGAKFGIGAER